MSELSPAPRLTTAQRRQDVWLAAGLLVAAVLSAWLGSTASVYGTESAPFSWALAYAVALTVPIAFRRRVPIIVLVVIAVAFFTGVSLRIPEVYVGNVTLFIAMYTVGAWVEDRRRATLARVLVIVGMFVWLTVVTFEASAGDDGGLSRAGLFSPFAAYMVLQFLVNAAFFGGAYLFGERAWMQARSRAALEARTAELERERELTAAQAVALDRVRIARELHDVVAHHVSAMGVQAGATRVMLDRDPAAARAGLEAVEQSAQAHAVLLQQRAHHLLGQAVVGALQLAEQQARHARVPGDEVDVRHEHGLERAGRAGGLGGRLVDAGQQALAHPGHAGLHDRILAREVPKQRPLRQAHALGNRGGGDVARVLPRGQVDQGLDGGRAPFVGREMSWAVGHGRTGLLSE